MSKLIKRIRKETKNLENCVILGNVWGNLFSVADSFQNVFIKITDTPCLKARNIILRNEFQEMAIFPPISYVFVDENRLDQLNSVEKVFTHFSPLIYIGCGEFLEKQISKYLNSLNYEIVELRSEYQVWKRKR